MKHVYLLLNALNADDFGCSHEEMVEAIAEFGCSVMNSQDMLGNSTYYATATTLEALEYLVNTTDLPGNCVKISAVYDATLNLQ